MTTTKFSLIRDINGYNGFGLPISNEKYSAIMAAGDEITLTAPTDYDNYIAIISSTPGTDIWVAVNETAEIPAGGTFALTTSEINPVARTVKAGDVLSFITDDTSSPQVGVCFYVISPYSN